MIEVTSKNRPRTVTRWRRGFSLLEAIISIGLVTMMGAVLLSATQVAVNATGESTDQAIAQGIALQVADEAMGLPYVAKSNTSSNPNNVLVTLGSGSNSGRRDQFDSIDDYNGANSTSTYSQKPAADLWGRELTFGDSATRGSYADTRLSAFSVRDDFFDNWTIESNVYYVSANDPSARLNSGTSYFRALEVRVYQTQPNGAKSLLASVRRIHSHVAK